MRGVRRAHPSATAWSLAALAAGFALGLAGHGAPSGILRVAAEALRPIGDLWVAALQVTALPLAISYTLAAVVGARAEGSVGTLAARTILLFLAMLVGAGLLTAALLPVLLSFLPVGPETTAALRAGTIPEAAQRAATGGFGSISEWLGGLLPRNLFEAAVRGDVLPLLLFAILFGLAVRQLDAERREPARRAIEALAAAMLVAVRWILVLLPVGVFILSFRLALDWGGQAAGALGIYVGVICGLLLLCTALLYPITSLFGRTTMASFARGAAPAQLVAVSTRSSIASLPALVEGARDRMRLPDEATGFVLPLSVSLFKLNRTISSTAKLLFLAHVYGVPIGPGRLATFLLTVVVMSFGTIGLPLGGGAFKTLPAYVAAGLPIEGLVIVEAVEAIPDVFKTLLNVTGDLSVATLVSRSQRSSRGLAAAETGRRAAGTV